MAYYIKVVIQKVCMVTLFLGVMLSSYADYSTKILELIRFDKLAKFQQSVKSKQVSSYDTTGANDDGFSGKYSFLREENGNQVIADLKGPGIIHRIWTPTPKDEIIQFFFDGESQPRIELKFIDLFSGEAYPFVRPVVGNEIGGYYCYLPIPYEKSLKIVFKGKMQFIQIQYSEVESGVVDKSFPQSFNAAEKSALQSVVNVWKDYGTNLLALNTSGNKEDLKIANSDISLKPGETLPIFNMNTGGRIVGIEISPKVTLNGVFKDLILKAKWDDEKIPAIQSPMTDFFGYAFGKPSARSLLIGTRNDIHYSYFPMPFDKKAILELEYLRDESNTLNEIPVNVKIYYTETKRANDEGKFYAEWKREHNPEMGKPYEILRKSGRGHHVGTFLQSQGLNSGMTIFFEGDDQCYVDGELRLHGTGSEDYFNGGWYALADRWDQGYSLPLHGCLDYSIPLARTGGYRLLMTDKISFEKDFLLTIEHGPENNNIPVDYVSVAFYYSDSHPMENPMPGREALTEVKSPKTLEYWLQLLPVKAFSHGASVSAADYRDEVNQRGYQVYKLEGNPNGFAKFELEVPGEGEYKLYMTYMKGPEIGSFDVYQRQIPIKKNINGYANKPVVVEKEYIGTLFIEEGTNTITVTMRDKPENREKNTFMLHRLYLEM